MTGNGKHTTYIFMMMTEGWFIVLLTLGRVIGGPPIRILHGFSMHVNTKHRLTQSGPLFISLLTHALMVINKLLMVINGYQWLLISN